MPGSEYFHKNRWIWLIIFLLVFSLFYISVTKADLSLIFRRDLYGHDETAHSIVSANITRQFYPAMLRLNSLVEGGYEKNWMYNAYFQRIPPLFTYAPWLLFKLDGQITIEVKRLSYASVVFLTGLSLILFSYFFTKRKILNSLFATIASILWVESYFTRSLINGQNFGSSDIVLSFFVVICFGLLIYYLSLSQEKRINSIWLLALMGAAVFLPIAVKQALGLIPAATFFVIFIVDNYQQYRINKKINPKILIPVLVFVVFLLVYYGSLFYSSPFTFKKDILASSEHISANSEGWARPWDYFLVNYLPKLYNLFWPEIILILIIYIILISAFRLKGEERRITTLSLGWFVWNLIVISIVTAKCPNFIFQSYLLFIFGSILTIYLLVEAIIKRIVKIPIKINEVVKKGLIILAIVAAIILFIIDLWQLSLLARKFREYRRFPPSSGGTKESFFLFGQYSQDSGWNKKDLFLTAIPGGDELLGGSVENKNFWLTYYVMFMSGAEGRTLDNFIEIYKQDTDSFCSRLESKYDNVYIIISPQDKYYAQLSRISEVQSPAPIFEEASLLRIDSSRKLCQIKW